MTSIKRCLSVRIGDSVSPAQMLTWAKRWQMPHLFLPNQSPLLQRWVQILLILQGLAQVLPLQAALLMSTAERCPFI